MLGATRVLGLRGRGVGTGKKTCRAGEGRTRAGKASGLLKLTELTPGFQTEGKGPWGEFMEVGEPL